MFTMNRLTHLTNELTVLANELETGTVKTATRFDFRVSYDMLNEQSVRT